MMQFSSTPFAQPGLATIKPVFPDDLNSDGEFECHLAEDSDMVLATPSPSNRSMMHLSAQVLESSSSSGGIPVPIFEDCENGSANTSSSHGKISDFQRKFRSCKPSTSLGFGNVKRSVSGGNRYSSSSAASSASSAAPLSSSGSWRATSFNGFGGHSFKSGEAAAFEAMQEMETSSPQGLMSLEDSPVRVLKRRMSKNLLSHSAFGFGNGTGFDECDTDDAMETEVDTAVLLEKFREERAERPCMSTSPVCESAELEALKPPARPLKRAQSMRIGAIPKCLPRSQSAPRRENGDSSRTSSRVIRQSSSHTRVKRSESFAFVRRPRACEDEEAEPDADRYRRIMMTYDDHSVVIKKREKGCAVITADEAAKLLSNKPGEFSDVLVIDCRWDYEYGGGHIKGARNLYTKEMVLDFFFDGDRPRFPQNTAIIMHCEFSSKRGPARFGELRDADRKCNLASYPEMFYPYLFLLEGGYKNFYAHHRTHCIGGYREMNDKSYAGDLKRCNRLFRARRKSSLSRRLTRSCDTVAVMGALHDENGSFDPAPLTRSSASDGDVKFMAASLRERRQQEIRSMHASSDAPQWSNADVGAPSTTVEDVPHGMLAYNFAHPSDGEPSTSPTFVRTRSANMEVKSGVHRRLWNSGGF